ncbi:MAG: aminotransferase class V-fold PLP-dependent enzyme [Bacteroidota bacterium]
MITQLRAETPGCLHRIHLNNAGAALPPLPVIQSMQEYLTLESEIGGYEANDLRAGDIAGFYDAFAALLKTKRENIAYAGSATDAYARALSAIPFKPGDIILTTDSDYSSNQIAFLSLEKRCGVRVLRARDTGAGGVDVADMEALILIHHPVLVAVTHVPTNSGLVQDVETIGQICRREGIWYLVDGCQSAGQMDLDMGKIGCDFFSATTRKYMRGPRGAGFLFASDRVLEAGLEMLLPDMFGATWTGADTYEQQPDARRFEYWERSQALMLGCKEAALYALRLGLPWIEQRVNALAAYTRAQLADIPGVRVLDMGEKLCGIVTAYAETWQPQSLMQSLQAENINCRISPLVAAQIDFPKKHVPWALRITPHYYNTEAEIDQTIAVCKRF